MTGVGGRSDDEFPHLNESIARLRRDHGVEPLELDDLDPDPIVQFGRWMEDALEEGLLLPNTMTLATADPGARPSARMVLLKGFDHRGFVFYTNYDSRKSRELAANPAAALVFYWSKLERQVRVEGRVEKVPAEESDSYFATRPLESRLGAWASRQSAPLVSRAELEERLAELESRYAGEVPRPPHWGGWIVRPDVIELWQGRPNRLHDRFLYTRRGDGWERTRLYP
ncbi:MAG TPA: pyridoxamine 5'-phosphate oxidase [Actinomycetota bacterium]|nr:pyridoxamine 5'-phosphate oxidase [Actinomycetota bacterium]